MKCCRDCGAVKVDSEFIKNRAFKSGRDTLCINCNRNRVKEWRKRNPSKRLQQHYRYVAKHKEQMKIKWKRNNRVSTVRDKGLTLLEFDLLFKSQGNCCAICKRAEIGKEHWCIDHDHSCCPTKHACGKCVRGILCTTCNLMIGYSRDNPLLLTSAINYLSRTTGY